MIVQAVNGKFYKTPSFSGTRWVLRSNILAYVGRVTWETARKGLTKLGLHFRLLEETEGQPEIISGRLQDTTAFVVRFTKPIPIPESFDAVLDSPDGSEDEIVRFPK